MKSSTDKILLRLQLSTESDIVVARRRARQIAFLLGFDAHDQTRISTAVSEIVRNAVVHAGGGTLDFSVSDRERPYQFSITLTDKGPGIPDLDFLMSGGGEPTGLLGAKRLVDKLEVKNLDGGGTYVLLQKELQARQKPFSSDELNELANSLTKIVLTNPLDEVHQQNQELLAALDQLSRKQAELDTANLELADKNQHLVEMNGQMTALNDSLEAKVRDRTSELLDSNHHLSLARDEAVLANKLKSQFVANISHEIRTPMNGILSATELVLDAGTVDEETQTLVGMAHQSAKDLMKIIDDLLDFAKLEAGKPTVSFSNFSLDSVIEDAINSVSGAAFKKGLPIHKNVAGLLEQHLLTGDPVLMQRVLLNLLHNAVKFTHSGQVVVTAEVVREEDKTLVVRCSVADTGIGIAKADMPRLFQPFVQVDGSNTRNYGGTGLGLSISNGYVELMGGSMGFESAEHKGSKFWFDVPVMMVA